MKGPFFLALVVGCTSFAVAQEANSPTGQQICAVSATTIVTPATASGTLRADGLTAENAVANVQRDVQKNCATFTSSRALQDVRFKINENHIVISGNVPTDQDEAALIAIAQSNADGRTVYNRLNVDPNMNTGAAPVAGQSTGTQESPSNGVAADRSSGSPSNVGVAPGTATTGPGFAPELSRRINTALQNEPSLAIGNVSAVVTADQIVLTGIVRSEKERQTAARIARSFDINRKLVDRITLDPSGSQQQ